MTGGGPVLVTGAAGFIGSGVTWALLERGETVVGIDNFNDYYDPTLKEARFERSRQWSTFHGYRSDIADADAIEEIFRKHEPRRVINLAAQAGVRHSLVNPGAYAQSNLVGFVNILQASRTYKVDHLVYASTSSVYGANQKLPFAITDETDHPVNLYAATKKANEVMAHSYSHLFGLPTTGLRFFTVYGPWGRPDMALFIFTECLLAGKPLPVFNRGHHRRDFTYINDIVEGVVRVLARPPSPNPEYRFEQADPSRSSAPFALYNIGCGRPTELFAYINALESELGKTAEYELLPMQAGDMIETFADVSRLERDFGYHPTTTVEEGVRRFVKWYREYYRK